MRRMVHRKQLGDSPATLSSPTAKREKNRASSKAAKLPDPLSQLILQAFEASTARKGLSLAALKKHLSEVGYSAPRNNSRLKRELNNLVAHGLLSRVLGTTGTFKVNRPKKRTGPLEPETKKKGVAGKKPQKKKKQPPGKKAKTPPRKSTSDPGRKRQQLRNHPAGANRKVPANKAARGRKESSRKPNA